MMYEIKLYGEVIPFANSEINYCFNLSYLQSELKKAQGKDLKVRINSIGGDVDEGFAIYNELRRYAKDNNASITTLAEGRCASIATIIFLAGDRRIITEHTEPFVHNAWTYVVDGADANKLKKVALDLDKCNDKIAKHYANHTELTYEEARDLMNSETFISNDEALIMKFATDIEIPSRPQNIIKILNKFTMKKTKETFKSKLNKFLSIINGIQNKIVYDAENKEIDFYELADEDVIEVGAKATIDGQNAEGEVTTAEGEIYVFEAGVLTEIKPSVQNAEDTEGKAGGKTVEELKEEIKELEEEIKTLEEENKELEEMLNKATTTIKNMRENLKKAQSKSVDVKAKQTIKSEEQSVSDIIKEWSKNKR